MTLSEIESILQELSARHQNLTEELLTTLLTSAGWEDKTIKEAVTLFKQNGGVFVAAPKIVTQTEQPKVTTPVAATVQATAIVQTPIESSDITFYQPDGTEEGKLPVFADTPAPKREAIPIIKSVPEPVVQPVPQSPLPPQTIEVTPPQETKREKDTKLTSAPPVVKIEAVPQQVLAPVTVTQTKPQPQVTTEPQSLIVHDTVEIKNTSKQTAPPDNLPLLPFESSPHVWSFSKYKDVFHGDKTSQPEEIKVISVMPQQNVVTQPAPSPEIRNTVHAMSAPHVDDTEVVIETVPLRKDDKPLVFLASIMLFAIILILGYMYSNGRL
jgi:hypothetical protein